MKLSKILGMFVFLAVCSSNIFGNPETQGSLADLEKFKKNLECRNCELMGFNLANIIRKNPGKKVDLQGSDCTGVYLNNVNLSKANLSHAKLNYADLNESNLEGANVRFAQLKQANMIKTNIQNAQFNHAYLKRTNFNGAKVNKGTSFENTNCISTDFCNILNLCKVKFFGAILRNCKLNWPVENMHKAKSITGINYFPDKIYKTCPIPPSA